MSKEVNSIADVVENLNLVVDELQEMRAEVLLHRLLLMHLFWLGIRSSKVKQKYFDAFRDSSRESIKAALFGSGRHDLNENVRRMALAKHEALFDEIGTAVGLQID